MLKTEINVVWFKKDLRFTDHEPLYYAQQSSLPLLLVYFFEPTVMAYADSDTRHWRFIYESLTELNSKLSKQDARIYIFQNEVQLVFEKLMEVYHINAVFSHEEIGNHLTFERDKLMKLFFKKNHIIWKEYPTNGIVRGLRSRKDWPKRWEERMNNSPFLLDESKLQLVKLDENVFGQTRGKALPQLITTRDENFQPGGESWAWRYLTSFINDRHVDYSKNIGNPMLSRKSCSRLSPYLTYGNISMRMLYQYTVQHYKNAKSKRSLSNFMSRLHWHCHFIQKFESACSYEFNNINRAFDQLIKPKNEHYIAAWQAGKTGVPIVDACIRCVVATGYINFIICGKIGVNYIF